MVAYKVLQSYGSYSSSLRKGLGGLKLLPDDRSRPLTGSPLYQVVVILGHCGDELFL